ncbi:MAG: hypothetical protein H0X03_02800 [Nitrosopumilus sp.]|nr:hypothetical protein [Nitrosopumilus sp.]
MVKCNQCGYEHPSGIQVNEKSFHKVGIPNNSERCPNCVHKPRYNRQDYHFQ